MAYEYLVKSRQISDLISRTDGSGKLTRDNLNFLLSDDKFLGLFSIGYLSVNFG
jgi:hypothetical protein